MNRSALRILGRVARHAEMTLDNAIRVAAAIAQ